MTQPHISHWSYGAVRSIVAVLSVLIPCAALGVDPPLTKPANGVVNPAADQLKIREANGLMRNVEVIWHTEIDRICGIAVGGETIVIGGRDGAHSKGRCLGLSKETGKILWSITHDALPQRVNDMAAEITSTPFIDADRAYYVSNRGELCCVRVTDGRVNWMLDMPKTLGVFKSDPGDAVSQAPSPIVVGDIVYCVTGNGVDYHRKVRAPDAPSFLAVDKVTGKVIWSSNAPGKNICYGQWSTPALANVDGAPEILFPGGDGALYAFEPLSGKQLWRVDCGGPRLRKYYYVDDFISAPPLVVGHTAYVSPATDCEASCVGRRLLAIDLRTHAIRWAVSPEGYSGTMGPMAFSNGAVYAASILGVVVAVDADTGKTRWTRELGEKDSITITGGVCLHNEKLYLVTQDGDLMVLSSSTGKTLFECDLGGGGIGTPIVDGKGVLAVSHSAAWLLHLPGD